MTAETGELVELRRPGDLVSFTDPQLNLIKRTICRPKNRECTNDELSLFVGQCVRTGLDPFSKQIYAIFRWSKRDKQEVMTVQTAIDGFRVTAERTGCYMGKVATYWCGEDAEWQEVWLAKEHPLAAKVIVRKAVAGHVVEIPAVAHWAEYADDMGMWKDMPANQLAKCAEALAIRQAFPNDLSGLYTTDEMAQADARPLAVASAPPAILGTAVESAPGAQPQEERVEVRINEEELAALTAALATAGIDDNTLTMLLSSVGVDCTEDLTPALLDELRQALGAHLAKAGASA